VIYTYENDLLEEPGLKHPMTYEQTLDLDNRNRNTLWRDATTLELTQINEYDTFIGKGHYTKVKTPDGFKKTQDRIAHYLSMIETLQQIVTTGWFNIYTAVITMSEFHMSPRVGHLNSSNCTYRYLLMMKHASIRIMPEEPDLPDFSDNVHYWTYSAYCLWKGSEVTAYCL
jgi:hypothetical protein